MKTLTSQQQGSPNRSCCLLCGTYEIDSYEKYCQECKRIKAIIESQRAIK